MADTPGHCAWPAWICYGSFLVSNQSFSIDSDQLWFLNFMVLASVLPDVPAEQSIWYARWRRFGKGREWFKPGRWKQTLKEVVRYDTRLTADTRILREEGSWAVHFYEFMCSVSALILVTVAAYWLWGGYYAIAWSVGYGLHIAVDYFSHDEPRPLYPLNLRVPCRTSWWDSWWYKPIITVPTGTAFMGTIKLTLLEINTALATCGILQLAGLNGIIAFV